MNRIEIKNKAKEMIKGNLWYIWKIYLVVFAVSFLFGFVGGLFEDIKVISFLLSIVSAVISAALSVGAIYYVLKFVRSEKIEIKEVFEFVKQHWVISVLSTLLVALCVLGGTILLVIPGIIVSFGLYFTSYVVVDNKELSVTEVIKKSWELTKGYKMELFVFCLSFMGWAILAPFTLGLLYIWLMPYITVATSLLYDELKKRQAK